MGSAALVFAPPGRTEWKRCQDRRSPHRGATEATSLDGVLYGSGVSGQQNRRANVAAADTHILL
ncbi:hypothetical protein SAMN03097719_3151 [Pantoea ananatis]|uniref:hypothetical protein n=1 Tax=Pantoea ananas TaxID=553 RepID=UPI0009CBE41B|nr:hypothetical protein [Pantoea ananatis]SKA78023.1 hypothetical protein SAMN03097719_3151 [Pantoea ananatis]